MPSLHSRNVQRSTRKKYLQFVPIWIFCQRDGAASMSLMSAGHACATARCNALSRVSSRSVQRRCQRNRLSDMSCQHVLHSSGCYSLRSTSIGSSRRLRWILRHRCCQRMVRDAGSKGSNEAVSAWYHRHDPILIAVFQLLSRLVLFQGCSRLLSVQAWHFLSSERIKGMYQVRRQQARVQ